MTGSLAVLHKEILDALGDRHSFGGFGFQAAVVWLLTGIVVPCWDRSIWHGASAPLVLFVMFPVVLAATIAADGFAGELERGTLETLLATPLSESALVIGKLLAATLFVVVVSALSFGSALLIAALRGFQPMAASLGLVLVVPLGAVSGGILVSALVSLVSLRIPVARSAQQIGAVLTYAVAAGVALLLANTRPSWPLVLAVETAVLALGVACVALACRAFRRERFFS